MSDEHFEVETVMDRSTPQKGTVSINRDNGLITIRPLRSRRVYVVPLNEAITMIVQRAIKQEVMEGKKPRKRKVARGLLSLRGF